MQDQAVTRNDGSPAARSWSGRTGLMLGAWALVVACVALFVGPIAPPVSYHNFADTRSCFGIANCGDVLSNAGFAIAGLLGRFILYRKPGLFGAEDAGLRALFALFFASVAFVSLGSGYYHDAPDNTRLFWDRLPITISFMALFSAILADRISVKFGVRLALVIVPLGVLALSHWAWSEAAGQSDLRFYALVQVLPLATLLVLPWLFPSARYSRSGYIYGMVALYGLAKLCETFDPETLHLLGNAISGHSIKHLLATAASFLVVPMMLAGVRGQGD